ncbi:type III-B CRISPR module RAMP protein Cmr1 [Ignatzschineria ureiclastica]|uniref:Type III-B CRISPR module RAMP protein Cmr1 n=1 Tax=Ignatzschineria ureiclastica TaxID=472582 RepID=A0A2U2AF00_9GAMM|nr:type III-B CRISPR module RAMP protein Cmr1 [Ignatzschineria ureiclastica]PWD81231.1 type III-B CRISPR module RAMP protein Cmr1 [Ignatzschineria ureiclastica]GGZ97323.1 type III-B CRISPR module RAMP protein Cmr1 [Ignatzschineria ureiclastica]
MAIRKIEKACPESIDVVSKWHHLTCQLVTPLYGGGVDSSTIDESMPIRTSSIKGQLRIWWRLLAKNLWKLGSDKEIRIQEFKLWGGIGKDDASHASEVFIRVSIPHDEYEKNKLVLNLIKHDEYTKKYSELKYLFFPADNNKNENNEVIECHLLQEGFRWNLSVKFSDQLEQNAILKQQVLETIRWWSQFGGIGARSRRGTGAFIITEASDLPEVLEPLTADDVAKAGCQLAIAGGQGDALVAWKNAVGKLSDFRQKANIGRNPTSAPPKPAGRSRWPEPDAIRRIQKMHDPRHEPEHKAGNIFPRGLFGMPIIFHFVGRGEPGDTSLQPKGKERLASPLFIRPFYNREKNNFSPAVLLTPYDWILEEPIELKGSRAGEVSLWDPKVAELITPIKDNGGDNPLTAFMNFFQKG